jgi:hypothetical protein
MKKILITLFLVSLLNISLSACAMASNSIYIDSLVSSSWESKYSTGTSDGDLSGGAMGANFAGEKYSLGFEYLDRTLKNPGNGDTDFKTITIKGGYNIISIEQISNQIPEQIRVALTLGYHNYRSDTSDIDGIVIGADLIFDLNKKFRMECSGGYSFSVKRKIDSFDDVNILATIRYLYLITNNLGVSIGCRLDRYKLDKAGEPLETYYGPTAGVVYRF